MRVHRVKLLIRYFNVFATSFQLTPLLLLLDSLALGTPGRFGGFTFGAGNGGTFEKFLQSIEGILSVLFLGAVGLGFNDNHAIFGDTAIAHLEEA